MRLKATRYEFVVSDEKTSGTSSNAAQGCSVIYYASAPTWNGGPGENEAYGFVDVTNGCTSGVSWTHDLLLYEVPGGYVAKDTDTGFVGGQDDAQTHVSADCIGNTTDDWANSVRGGATEVNDLPCTA